jgi:hypothetical protein
VNKNIRNTIAILFAVLFPSLVIGQPAPPPDSVSGTLAGTGAAGSGGITLSSVGNLTAASNVHLIYYRWDPNLVVGDVNGGWVLAGTTSDVNLPQGGFTWEHTPPGTISGKFYCAKMQIIRNNVVIKESTSNTAKAK